MSTNQAAKIAVTFVGEVLMFIEPIVQAAGSIDKLRDFFKEMGYDPTSVDGSALSDAFGAMDPSMSDSLQAILQGGPDMLPRVGSLFGQLKDLDGLPAVTNIIDNPGDFFDEVFDRLTYKYLMARAPVSMTVLDALGVLERALVAPSDPGGRDVAYTKVRLNWPVLGLFFKDNRQWAYDVYGWGENPAGGAAKGFDHVKAIQNMANIIKATQIATVYQETLTPAEKQQFLQGAGSDDVMRMNLPFFQDDFDGFSPDNTPQFNDELGLTVLPYGNLAQKANVGFAVAPYAKAGQTVTVPLSKQLSLRLEADISGTGGAYVTAQPSGLGVEAGAAVTAAFEMTAVFQAPDNEPTSFFGSEGTTNMRVDRILGTIGGSISAATAGAKTGDLFVATGVEGLKASIDVGEDGLLASVIPEPIEVDAGDILVGWRTGRGVYFEGGTSLSVTVPLDLPIGPITLYEATIALDWEDEVRADFMITADLTVGPVYAYAENIGISGTLVEAPDGDGLLGKYDVGLGFIPPTGYAVSLDAEVLSGGGLLSVGEDEYRGALALQFANFGLSAFAILNTRLPGGERGFSLGASIFADINIPLAYGFFLTGLGGVIGINRTVDTDALRDVMYEGRMDNLLFPSDPIENAVTILDDMAAILPPREGQHLFGPAARISWGQPQIIDIKLGVVLEVGGEFRLIILGGLGLNLPDRDVALVALNLSFFGEIDFSAGTISFDATLEGSRILAFTVTGDMALRTGWGNGITHIASFGGLHPRYPRPANLPDLRRLSIAFGTNNPKITLSAYNAIAMNAVMFGARADLYAKGPKIKFVGQVAAKGFVSFDALIYFNPFSFDIMLAGGLSLLVDGKSKAELGFSLSLQGPNTFRISGKVWVKIFGIKVKFGITHTWGNRQNVALPQVNAAEELRRALEGGKGFEPITSANVLGGVTFAETEGDLVLIDPVGGMRLTQTAVPLDLAIQKIGETTLTGPKKLDLEILSDGTRQTLTPHRADFVRSHFFNTSDSEKLRLPSFESHKAGYEFSADALAMRADKQIEETYEYEVIEIEGEPENPRLAQLGKLIPLTTKFADRFGAATYGGVLRPTGAMGPILKRNITLEVKDTGYVPAKAVTELQRDVARGPSTGPAIATLVQSSDVIRRNFSDVMVETERSAEVANDQVSSYIAAAVLKEAV